MFMNVNFIAEVSSNHHRDLQRCFDFIDAAAEIGCQAVKFQLFKIDQLFAPEILSHSAEHRRRSAWELPVSFLAPLAERCRQRHVQFSCTPFYLDAVAELEPYVDFYKIASYELLWDDLIEACGRTGKPLVLSTGMASLAEIDHAVAIYRQCSNAPLTLLHCVSGYPVPMQECNLAVIEMLRDRYNCAVGWSDHSHRPEVIHRAVQHWQATTIEFHLDLDGKGDEFQAGHCWLPGQMAQVIAGLGVAESADGDGLKVAQKSEENDRLWRADPLDGLRPLRELRQQWRSK